MSNPDRVWLRLLPPRLLLTSIKGQKLVYVYVSVDGSLWLLSSLPLPSLVSGR